jgi:hypothetical protein
MKMNLTIVKHSSVLDGEARIFGCLEMQSLRGVDFYRAPLVLG